MDEPPRFLAEFGDLIHSCPPAHARSRRAFVLSVPGHGSADARDGGGCTRLECARHMFCVDFCRIRMALSWLCRPMRHEQLGYSTSMLFDSVFSAWGDIRVSQNMEIGTKMNPTTDSRRVETEPCDQSIARATIQSPAQILGC